MTGAEQQVAATCCSAGLWWPPSGQSSELGKSFIVADPADIINLLLSQLARAGRIRVAQQVATSGSLGRRPREAITLRVTLWVGFNLNRARSVSGKVKVDKMAPAAAAQSGRKRVATTAAKTLLVECVVSPSWPQIAAKPINQVVAWPLTAAKPTVEPTLGATVSGICRPECHSDRGPILSIAHRSVRRAAVSVELPTRRPAGPPRLVGPLVGRARPRPSARNVVTGLRKVKRKIGSKIWPNCFRRRSHPISEQNRRRLQLPVGCSRWALARAQRPADHGRGRCCRPWDGYKKRRPRWRRSIRARSAPEHCFRRPSNLLIYPSSLGSPAGSRARFLKPRGDHFVLVVFIWPNQRIGRRLIRLLGRPLVADAASDPPRARRPRLAELGGSGLVRAGPQVAGGARTGNASAGRRQVSQWPAATGGLSAELPLPVGRPRERALNKEPARKLEPGLQQPVASNKSKWSSIEPFGDSAKFVPPAPIAAPTTRIFKTALGHENGRAEDPVVEDGSAPGRGQQQQVALAEMVAGHGMAGPGEILERFQPT